MINENKRGNNQAESEHDEQNGFDDEDEIPGDPAFGERPEGTDPVVVGEVEENVTEAGEAGINEEQSPARGKVGIARFAAAQTPEEIDESDDCRSHDGHAEERMSETTVMVEAESGSAEAAEDIKVGCLGG